MDGTTGGDDARWRTRNTRPVAPEDFDDDRARSCFVGYRAWREHRFGEAVRVLDAVVLADGPRDVWLARALLTRAAVLSELGLDEAAMADNEASLRLSREIGYVLGEAAALHDRAHYPPTPLEVRADYARQAREVVDAAGAEADELRALMALNAGLQAFDEDSWDDGVAELVAAVELGDVVWPLVAATARVHLAARYSSAGRIEEALALLAALPELEDVADAHIAVLMACSVAEVFRRIGEPERAIRLLEHARAMAPRWRLAEIHAELSLTHEASGDLRAALDDARAAYGAARAAGESAALERGRALEVFFRTQAVQQAHAREQARADELEAALAGLEDAHSRLVVVSRLDPLTGLLNRQAFERDAQQRLPSPGAELALADLDSFKVVNDVFGHGAGDDVLRGVALLLVGALREDDLVCRFGGEEFVVLRPTGGDLTRDLRAIAARLRDSPWRTRAGDVPPVTLSAGVVPVRGGDVHAAVAAADALMYDAKRAGGDEVRD